MSNMLSIHGELNNFIDYYTSDDELRRKMRDCVSKEKFPLTELSAKVHKYQALGCVVEIR